MRRIATALSLSFALTSFAGVAGAQQALVPSEGGEMNGAGATPPSSGPQPSPEDLTEARAQFGAGVAAFRARHYPDAVIAFERSLHLRPHPTTLYNAAEARFRAGDRSGALQQLREMLAMTNPAPSQNDIDRARALAHEGGVETLEPAPPQNASCPICPTCAAETHECPTCPPPQIVHEPAAGVPIVPIVLMAGGAVVFGTGMILYGYALADAYVYADPRSADTTRQLVRPQGEAFRWVGLLGILAGLGAEAAGVVLAVQHPPTTRHTAAARPAITAHLDAGPTGIALSGTF